MRLCTAALLALLSAPASAQGIYDGIWQFANTGYISIHQNGDTLAMITMDTGALDFDVATGTLSGTMANVETVVGNGIINIDLTFISDSQVSIRINSCVPNPGFACSAPVGSTLLASRIF